MTNYRTEDEKRFLQKIQGGQCADFTKETARPVIRARIIKDLLLGRLLPEWDADKTLAGTAAAGIKRIKISSLSAKGITIKGKLDLVEAIRVSGEGIPPLILENVWFETGDENGVSLDARHARLTRLSMRNCKFSRIVLDDAKIGGDVDLSYAESNAGDGVCQVVAKGCRVEGSLTINYAALRINPSAAEPPGTWEGFRAYALNLTGAVIEGELFLNGLSAVGGIRLDHIRTRGSVWIDGATLTAASTGPFALHAHYCRIGGDLYLSGNPREGDEEPTQFKADGSISLTGARIDGDLDCRGAYLRGGGEKDDLNDGAEHALNADGARIGADVFFRVSRLKFRFVSEGSVSIRGATIGGDLDCHGACFIKALDASNVRVGANVYLCGGENSKPRFVSQGGIKLNNTRIVGRLECREAELHDPCSQYSIDASELRVDGNLVFKPKLEGNANFPLSRIGGDLDLNELTFAVNSKQNQTLSFSGAIVDRRIAVDKIQVEQTQGSSSRSRPHIDLESVKAGSLADNGGLGWKGVMLTLDGLTYSHVNEIKEKRPVWYVLLWRNLTGFHPYPTFYNRREWLSWQYENNKVNSTNYRPQPYEHLARVLDEQGYNGESRRTLQLKLRRDGMRMPLLMQILHWFLGVCFGYGLSSRRALITFALYIALGGAVFYFTQDSMIIDANHVTVLADGGKPASILPGTHVASQVKPLPCNDNIRPLIYALDTAIPLLDLHEETRCTFKDDDEYLLYFRSFYELIGWIITSITVLTLTGVLRRTAEQ